MPVSRFAGFLALVVVLAHVGADAQAQSRSPAGDSSDFAASRSTGNRQAAWVEPADSVPVSGQGDRSDKRAAAPEGRSAAIPLRPPSRPDRDNSPNTAASQGGLRTVVSVGGSLGAVLGLFFLLAWAMRRGVPGAVGLLPAEALEVLGRAPLAGRQQVHLVRLGSKLVLVSVSPTGTETLSEVTEPDEVQRLIAICRQTHTTSAASMFRQALDRFATHKEPSDA